MQNKNINFILKYFQNCNNEINKVNKKFYKFTDYILSLDGELNE